MARRIDTWESLLKEGLNSDLSSQWIIRCYNQVNSTIDEARSLLPEVAPERPGLVLAARQISGRGQQGRKWLSAQEGLFVTYVFKSAHALNADGFTLAVSNAVSETLLAFGCETFLKWPNDVVSRDGRKLCGILAESVPVAEGRAVLCSIGVNIAGEPAEIPASTSICTIAGYTVSPVALAEKFAMQVFSVWKEFIWNGFQSFRETWLKRALYRGQRMVVDAGGRYIEGVFADISPSGALVLRHAGGVKEIASGHVLTPAYGQEG